MTLGGRRVLVARPRRRAGDGSGELPVTSYELFSDTEILGRIAPRRMLAGLSTRRYPVPVALEPIGARADRDVALRGVPAACGPDRARAAARWGPVVKLTSSRRCRRERTAPRRLPHRCAGHRTRSSGATAGSTPRSPGTAHRWPVSPQPVHAGSGREIHTKDCRATGHEDVTRLRSALGSAATRGRSCPAHLHRPPAHRGLGQPAPLRPVPDRATRSTRPTTQPARRTAPREQQVA